MMKTKQILHTVTIHSQHLPRPSGSGSPALCNSHSAPHFYRPPPQGSRASWGPPGFWGLDWIPKHLNTFQGRRYAPLQHVSESTVSPYHNWLCT